MSASAAYILLDDQITHELRYYTDSIDIIEAYEAHEVETALTKLKTYHSQGYYLAGYMAYELGLALEPKLARLMPRTRSGPLLQFGVFKSVSDQPPIECLYTASPPNISLTPHWAEAEYTARFNTVMEYIRAGDVYQINLTFPMSGVYDGTAAHLYAGFRHRQKGRYGGIVSLGAGPEIISLSPELFFRKDGRDMSMRPMKGTRPRAQTLEADTHLRDDMRSDAKSQAENLMIVDLLRNDLSRVSKVGSVQVPELFSLETYSTLHQMTSRVTSRLKANIDFADIFKSLFPCGSITGAPKIRAMEIIDELEGSPRGAYCGAMGYIDPDGDACFNVAIRTAILDGDKLTYNVGSGLVLDSEASDEYAECLLKADVLRPEETELIETFFWDAKLGARHFSAHRARLKLAAQKLSYNFSRKMLSNTLAPLKDCAADQRVKISLNKSGTFTLSHQDYRPLDNITFALSRYPLSTRVQVTDYKISRRQFYEGERQRLAALTGADEVVFLNENGFICEGSFTSLFIEKDGQLFTPPLSAGLLPGILRRKLIDEGEAVETELTIKDLHKARKIYLGNSLRDLIPAKLISPKPC